MNALFFNITEAQYEAMMNTLADTGAAAIEELTANTSDEVQERIIEQTKHQGWKEVWVDQLEAE